MGCGASSADREGAAGGEDVVQRSPMARVDAKEMVAPADEFSGWQEDTFSPKARAAKDARAPPNGFSMGTRNPNDISAPRDAVPAAAQPS